MHRTVGSKKRHASQPGGRRCSLAGRQELPHSVDLPPNFLATFRVPAPGWRTCGAGAGAGLLQRTGCRRSSGKQFSCLLSSSHACLATMKTVERGEKASRGKISPSSAAVNRHCSAPPFFIPRWHHCRIHLAI